MPIGRILGNLFKGGREHVKDYFDPPAAHANVHDGEQASAGGRDIVPTSARNTLAVKGAGCEQQLGVKEYRELGLVHTKLNVVLNGFVSAEKKGNTEPFEFEGHTLYWNKNFADNLHKKVASCLDELGAEVSFVCLVAKSPMANSNAFNRNGEVAKQAKFFAPELDGVQGLAFKAALQRLAQKYANRVQRWIYLNEIDAHFVWANCGERDGEDYCADYVRGMQTLCSALSAVNPNALAYVSFTRHWCRRALNHPRRSCPPLTMLKHLLRSPLRDLDWGIAFHPYGQDPWATLNVPQAFNLTTQTIDMGNIEVLLAALSAPEAQFHGRRRKLIFSEQGYQSRGGAKDQRRQAASLLFAFAKIRFVPGCEAFHLHRLFDIPQDVNRFGLIARDGKKKIAYNVYAKIAPDASNIMDLINGEYHDIWMEFVGKDLRQSSPDARHDFFVRKVLLLHPYTPNRLHDVGAACLDCLHAKQA